MYCAYGGKVRLVFWERGVSCGFVDRTSPVHILDKLWNLLQTGIPSVYFFHVSRSLELGTRVKIVSVNIYIYIYIWLTIVLLHVYITYIYMTCNCFITCICCRVGEVSVHAMRMCGEQQTTFRSHLFPSTLWVAGIKLRPSGSPASPHLLGHHVILKHPVLFCFVSRSGKSGGLLHTSLTHSL